MQVNVATIPCKIATNHSGRIERSKQRLSYLGSAEGICKIANHETACGCEKGLSQAGPLDRSSPPAYCAVHLGRWIDPAKVQDVQVTLSSSKPEKCASVEVAKVTKAEPPFKFAGICACLLASFFFASSILIVKMLLECEDPVGNAQLMFFRGMVIMILCSISIICTGETFLVCREELLMNFLRAFFGTLAVLGAYCALHTLSAGDSSAIAFSAPIWTSILGYFILGEPLHWIHFVGLPASLFGIVLIAHPTLIVPDEYLWTVNGHLDNCEPLLEEHLSGDFDIEQRWPGVVFAVLTSFAITGIFLVLKFRKRTSIHTTTFWFATLSCLTGALLMLFLDKGKLPSTFYQWQLVLANGTFSWLGQSTLQWAFTYEKAGLLSILRTADVAITFALSAIFLDDAIYWTSIAGAAIISAVVVLIVLSNWINTLACCRPPSKQADFNRELPITVACGDGKPDNVKVANSNRS